MHMLVIKNMVNNTMHIVQVYSMELHSKSHYKAFHLHQYFHYILRLIYQLFYFWTNFFYSLGILLCHMVYHSDTRIY